MPNREHGNEARNRFLAAFERSASYLEYELMSGRHQWRPHVWDPMKDTCILCLKTKADVMAAPNLPVSSICLGPPAPAPPPAPDVKRERRIVLED